jgi:hypothetical protein
MLAFEGRSRRSVAESKGKTGTYGASWCRAGVFGARSGLVPAESRPYQHRRGRVGAVSGFSGARSGLVGGLSTISDAWRRFWSRLRRSIRCTPSFAQDGRIANISAKRSQASSYSGEAKAKSLPTRPPRCRVWFLPGSQPTCMAGFEPDRSPLGPLGAVVGSSRLLRLEVAPYRARQ